MFLVCRGEYLPKVVKGKTIGETESVMGTQGSIMSMGSVD